MVGRSLDTVAGFKVWTADPLHSLVETAVHDEYLLSYTLYRAIRSCQRLRPLAYTNLEVFVPSSLHTFPASTVLRLDSGAVWQ